MENAVPHPFADLVGFEVTSRADGICVSEMVTEEKHMNPHGVVHGAVIYALADTGMGGALTSQLAEGEICSTIEIKINYFRPAIAGRLSCRTEVINKGRKTAVMESTVSDENGRLIAKAMGTFMIIAP